MKKIPPSPFQSYQAIADARTAERRARRALEWHLTFKRDDRDITFGQMLAALRDIYADLAGEKLPNTVVDEHGLNKKGEIFAVTNGNGRGLFFHIIELGDAADNPPVYLEYRCESVGLPECSWNANVAWLDEYSYKVLGVNTILAITFSAESENTAERTRLTEAFRKHLAPLGYELKI